ncbi:MAG: tRNA (N6-isopentenyl adenosine(37)-C2)-methylthiotransferase MiaB [Planctomycetota bacterium]|jgi:tRNA-2-methylthio-N6-dimethylallyladenosine synthase
MSAPAKYFLYSYGCQMNKLDSELVESKLQQSGYERAEREEDAGVILLNTCSVRQHAEDRVWSHLGRLRIRKRRDAGLVVGVMGCMAGEHRRSMQARMPHVDLVFGPSAFGDIDAQIDRARQLVATRGAADAGAGLLAVGSGVSGDGILREVRTRPHRSQAFVSIMRGCNMPCTYCIVPATRGKEISRPVEVIAEEVKRLVDDGVSEVTLLGQTVNAYGRDLAPKSSLSHLLRELHEIEGLRRLAFITAHPNFLNAELIDCFAELPKIGRYLHLPAQSGSDRVLANMQRGYSAAKYMDRVEKLWGKAPDIEMHSDFIVGFPGETEADLLETVDLMQTIRFAQSYVFKYSPRPGTVANDLVDDVPEDEKARRNQVLLAVQEEHSRVHNERQVGRVLEALVEGPSKVEGRLSARCPSHRLVHFDGDDEGLAGKYVAVRVTQALSHSLIGELVDGFAGVSQEAVGDGAEVPA